MTVREFIGNKVKLDEGGAGYIWGIDEKEGLQMIAETRGYGAIQNLFKAPNGTVDFNKADKFQDELGQFIVDAINEKLAK